MKRTLVNSICLLSSLLLVASFSLSARAQGHERGEGRWERLGQSHVDGRHDHDNISVNARGAFRAIQLRVQSGAIEFQRVVVHFENGADTDVQIRDRIESGGTTRAIDLPGDRRKIRSVEIWYAKESWGSHRPTLVLSGQR